MPGYKANCVVRNKAGKEIGFRYPLWTGDVPNLQEAVDCAQDALEPLADKYPAADTFVVHIEGPGGQKTTTTEYAEDVRSERYGVSADQSTLTRDTYTKLSPEEVAAHEAILKRKAMRAMDSVLSKKLEEIDATDKGSSGVDSNYKGYCDKTFADCNRHGNEKRFAASDHSGGYNRKCQWKYGSPQCTGKPTTGGIVVDGMNSVADALKRIPREPDYAYIHDEFEEVGWPSLDKAMEALKNPLDFPPLQPNQRHPTPEDKKNFGSGGHVVRDDDIIETLMPTGRTPWNSEIDTKDIIQNMVDAAKTFEASTGREASAIVMGRSAYKEFQKAFAAEHGLDPDAVIEARIGGTRIEVVDNPLAPPIAIQPKPRAYFMTREIHNKDLTDRDIQRLRQEFEKASPFMREKYKRLIQGDFS